MTFIGAFNGILLVILKESHQYRIEISSVTLINPFYNKLNKQSSVAARLFSAAGKLLSKVKTTRPVASLKDHWMKLVSLGSITAGIWLISVPAALITFGVLFFGLEALVGE